MAGMEGDAFNATPVRRTLMADGPSFDLSDLEASARATPGQQASGHTAMSYDRGSSSRKTQGNYAFNEQVLLEGGTALAGGGQFDVYSGVCHLLQTPDSGMQIATSRNYTSGPATTVGVLQRMPPSGTLLAALPKSFGHQGGSRGSRDQNEHQRPRQRQHQVLAPAPEDKDLENLISAKLADFMALLLQRDQESQAKIESACNSMLVATERMNQLATAIVAQQAAAERAPRHNLDLQLACGVNKIEPRFNWMFGHGVTPRIGGKATPSRAKFDRQKTNFMKFALWFTDNASEDELSEIWIQFNDTPRVVVDGHSIKRMLVGLVDWSEYMAHAMVRVLRRDEAEREPDSKGLCHYVDHVWALRVVQVGASSKECEELFQRPRLPYSLIRCLRVVAMVNMDLDGWASMSIDFKTRKMYLIHPGNSTWNRDVLYHHHLPLMQALTAAAQTHMENLGNLILLPGQWDFEIALSPVLYHGRDTGFCTAFYSIPKDEQFMTVSEETISLAKRTFIYSLVMMAKPYTKQRIRKGARKVNLKRDRKGKFVANDSAEHTQSAGSASGTVKIN